MPRRSRSLGGKLRINSQKDKSTIVEFEMSLPKASQI